MAVSIEAASNLEFSLPLTEWNAPGLTWETYQAPHHPHPDLAEKILHGDLKAFLFGLGPVYSAHYIVDLIRLKLGNPGNLELTLADVSQERVEQFTQLAADVAVHDGVSLDIHSVVLPRNDTDLYRRQLTGSIAGQDVVISGIGLGGLNVIWRDAMVVGDFLHEKAGTDIIPATYLDSYGLLAGMKFLREQEWVGYLAEAVNSSAPDAYIINSANPMGLHTGYLARETNNPVIGFCHEHKDDVRLLASKLNRLPEDLKSTYYGINHISAHIQLTDLEGNDLYPQLIEVMTSRNNVSFEDGVRVLFLRRYQKWLFESSGHALEYIPLLGKDVSMTDLMREGINPHGYLLAISKVLQTGHDDWEKVTQNLDHYIRSKYSHNPDEDYLSIMLRRFAGLPVPNPALSLFEIHGNVINNASYIPNLPTSAVVEVPIGSQPNYLSPRCLPDLPEFMVPLIQPHIQAQHYLLDSVINGSQDGILASANLDPVLSNYLDSTDLNELTRRLLAAQGKMISANLRP